jgi:Zn-dependent protease with chaperone function
MKPQFLSVLLFVLTCICVGFVYADTKSAIVPFDEAKARAASQIKDPAAATRAYLDSVPLERREKTKAYAHGNYVLDTVDFLITCVVMILLISTGISVRLRNLARRMTRFRPLQTLIYWIQFLVITTLVQFPFTLYKNYFREKQYGLLTQNFSGYMADQAKGLLLGCLLGGVLFMILYGVLRRAPKTWWIWGSVVTIVFLIFVVAIGPVFILPMFNKFTPIKNEEIREHILKMAHEQGISANEVYEMDASKRTDRVSAFVNGMLGTMRIVMFDNTLKRCTPEEIQMIMGHEMGHYVLNHVWKGVAFYTVVILLGFLFLRWAFDAVLRRWPNTGIEGVADPAGLPLLVLLLSAFLFFTSPITNTYSRWAEHEADNFGLNASHQPDAAATTFLKLGEYRDLTPSPIIEVLFFDHPSGESRIRNAMQWKATH